MKKALQIIAFFAFGLFMFYLVYQNQTSAYAQYCMEEGIPDAQCSLSDKLISDFGRVKWGWIGMVALVFTISNLFRAVRWRMQFAAMGYDVKVANGFWSIIFGYFANLGFPRIGEVLRAGLITKYDGVPMEKTVGSLVIDRLADFICLLIIVAIAFLVEFDTIYAFITDQLADNTSPEKSSVWIQRLPYIIGGLGIGTLAALYLFRKQIQQLSIYKAFIEKLKGFWQGIISIRKLDNPLLFSALSMGIWIMFYLQCLFTMWSFPPTEHLGVQPALMVFILGTLGFIIPTPGGMGSYHALAIAALALYGISGADGFSYANIAFFTLTIFYNVVGGLLALVILPRINPRAGK